MQPNCSRYRAIGQRFVSGFLQPEILVVLDFLDGDELNVDGSGHANFEKFENYVELWGLQMVSGGKR